MDICPRAVLRCPGRMAETWTRLLSSITDSSVWFEDDKTLRVWIAMLAMSDRDGYVWASVLGVANRAQVTVEQAESALRKFQEPDPRSRSKEHDGRRVEEVDRGWLLLNKVRFRDMRDEDERRRREREKKRAQRAKAKNPEHFPESPQPVNEFDGSPDETICPLSLAERAEPRVIPELASKLPGATVEQVRDSVQRCVAHYTIGKGMGQRRRFWMRVVRQWVTKDHGDKNLTRETKQPRNVASKLLERAERMKREAAELEGKAAE